MWQPLGPANVTASLGCASAPAYTHLFAFGDSLSDAGNLYIADGGTLPVSPYSAGHFSNGPTWVEDLSEKLGLGTLTPSLEGGNDFAFGGAQTGATAIEGYNPIDLCRPRSRITPSTTLGRFAARSTRSTSARTTF